MIKFFKKRSEGIVFQKKKAIRSTVAFIQIIHKYRDSFVGNDHLPSEHVAIFDEAQRAWTQDMIAKFMLTKKGVSEFPYSEPEFLISTMDRHLNEARTKLEKMIDFFCEKYCIPKPRTYR